MCGVAVSQSNRPAPYSADFQQDCAAVDKVLQPLLRERGISIHPQSCMASSCFTLTGSDFKDANGKRVTGNRVNKEYAATPKGKHAPFGQWVSMSRSVQVQGSLEFASQGAGCKVSMQLDFLTSGTLYVVIVPVDTDAALLHSNQKLEREYLDAAKQRLTAK
jgi:hypothetical protein